ncbi:hypothetical protein [Reichenbachiella ulvae]|uniref:Type II secretion system protein GspC N-terminal domain-containing protein n=1 Tax=Reichenbachiella ulvae TaxID=2980104 RepID=A0ABT3CV09_9BACT|nr:hypothetical protein [Reichenbachiella ulvae]MCV9387449.1 hypothetical protein [Reichenbachiella ulvae]
MSFINNKKFQPVLIVLVVGLWITIAYRVVDSLQGEEEMRMEGIDVSKVRQSSGEASVWALDLDFQDPFIRRKVVHRVKKMPKKKFETNEPIEKPPLSIQVVYQGLVSPSGSGQKMAMISRNNISRFYQKGEMLDGYQLTSVTEDSIVLFQEPFRYAVYR